MSIKEGGAFNTFRDPNGNPLITLNRDGTILTAGIDFADGTVQTTAAGGGGAVSSVFGRSGAVVAANGDYTASQVGAIPSHQVVVNLNDTQILNMNDDNSPVVLVPAVSGKAAIPTSVVCKFTKGGAAFYTGTAANDLNISNDGSATGFPSPLFIGSTQVLLDGTVVPNVFEILVPGNPSAVFAYQTSGSGNLVISCTSTLAGGGSGNILSVSVQYLVCDIATGVFS
jgi:hypothetical protein